MAVTGQTVASLTRVFWFASLSAPVGFPPFGSVGAVRWESVASQRWLPPNFNPAETPTE